MTSGGTESILMSMLVNRERALRPGRRAAADRRARSRRTPPTRRPRTTSAWTSCASRSTRDYRADVGALRRRGRRRHRGRRGVGVQLPVRRHGPGRGHRRDRGRARHRLPRRRVHRRVRAAVPRARSGTTCRRGTSASRASPRCRADVHKYGYCPKGASVILHRDADWFGHQFFLFSEWGSGLGNVPVNGELDVHRAGLPSSLGVSLGAMVGSWSSEAGSWAPCTRGPPWPGARRAPARGRRRAASRLGAELRPGLGQRSRAPVRLALARRARASWEELGAAIDGIGLRPTADSSRSTRPSSR